MNILMLKEATNEYVVYLYRPEGKGSAGEIRMGYSDSEATIVSRSDEDKHGLYAFKAADAVERCVSKRNLPIEFTNAWV